MTFLNEFENTLSERNPNLGQSLRPGLPGEKVRQILKRAKVTGDVEPIVALFTWKNGCQPGLGFTMRLFPTLDFQFWDLNRMVAYFAAFQDLAKENPRLRDLANRYFPIFWNGTSRWLAIDLREKRDSQIVVIDLERKPPVEGLSSSFDKFIREAIQPQRAVESQTGANSQTL